MKSHLSFGSVLVLVLICSACGGGGGGGEGGGAGAVDTNQALALTNNNAVPVSGLAVAVAAGGITVGSLGNVVIASADTANESNLELNLLGITQNVLEIVQAIRSHESPVTAGFNPAQVPPSVGCSGGGTVNAIWNDSDLNGELSIGEGISLFFDGCVEDGTLLNGPSDVAVLDLAGDPTTDPAWMVVLRLNLNGLTATDSDGTLEIVGSLDVTVDSLASGEIVTTITTEVATGPGTTASSFLYFGEGDDFIELTLYSVSLQENVDGSFVLSSQGTLESSLIGGTVTFETLQDVTGTDFDVNNPAAGDVLIVGAGNSNVLLRILDDVAVELDVDDEGDGFDAGDATISSSWAGLDAAVDAL